MPVTTETLALQAALRAALADVNNEQVQDLVAAWSSAWDSLSPLVSEALLEAFTAAGTDDGSVTVAQLRKNVKLQKALAAIADSLDDLVGDARARFIDDLRSVIQQAGDAQAAIVASQLPATQTELVRLDAWTRVDPRQVDAIVSRTTQQITSRSLPLSDEAYAVVQRELVRGVALGRNPRGTAARMVRSAEQGFNGGLNRAMVIARTETLDAHRAAAALGQAEQADVLAGWLWDAKLDGRTCRSCWAQHGKLHALDELGPLDHQQGRCSRLPKTKSWAELGIDGMDDEDEPDDLTLDPVAEFDALTSVEQMKVLGARGYAAWKRGDYPMEAWSQLERTEGWRDSYHETKPPPAPGPRQAIADLPAALL